MRTVNRYTDEFKKNVVKEVLEGRIYKDEARRRYGIKGKSAVLNWIRKFDASQNHGMKDSHPTPTQPHSQLEEENKRLSEELELERLRTLSLNVMIDLAEEQFKIPIRKKSGAKQWKK